MENKLLGLGYLVNDRSDGCRVTLYRSYKTAIVTPGNPYFFTDSDDTSLEALRYYQSSLPRMGVSILTNEDQVNDAVNLAKSLNSGYVKRSTPLVATPNPEPRVEAAGKGDAAEQAPEVEVKEEVEVKHPEVSEGVSGTPFSSYSDMELSEYLDMNYNRDQLKELITTMSIDYSVGRKSENTIISDLVSNHRSKLVDHLK